MSIAKLKQYKQEKKVQGDLYWFELFDTTFSLNNSILKWLIPLNFTKLHKESIYEQ